MLRDDLRNEVESIGRSSTSKQASTTIGHVHQRILQRALFGLLSALVLPDLSAATVSLVGSLNPNDPNDVLLVGVTLSKATDLSLQSYGYGGTSAAPGGVNAAGDVIPADGFDPYLSIFLGEGSAATFLASNDDGPCPPAAFAPACRDPGMKISSLAAGSYTLALSVFGNFSFAENFGTGTLGDGFIGLGDYYNADSDSVRTPNYAMDITGKGIKIDSVSQSDPALPEPATPLLAAVAALFLFALRTIIHFPRRSL